MNKTFKILSLVSLFVLTITIGVVFATKSNATSTKFDSVQPLAFEVGTPAMEVPEGFVRVSFNTTNEQVAQDLWKRVYGNLDGYTLDKANTITGIYDKNAVPCRCKDDFLPNYVYIFDRSGSYCDDCRSASGESCQAKQ